MAKATKASLAKQGSKAVIKELKNQKAWWLETDFWTTKEAERIAIHDMDTEHLQNTINMLLRHPKKYYEDFSRAILTFENAGLLTHEQAEALFAPEDRYTDTTGNHYGPIWISEQPVFQAMITELAARELPRNTRPREQLRRFAPPVMESAFETL